MELSNLYLLEFKQGNYIKIGKADNIHNRIKTLQRIWGEVDYEASYYLQAPTSIVQQLESALLLLLAQYTVPYPQGDGRTELRAKPSLGIALRYLEIFCLTMPDIGGVHVGVPRPALPLEPARRHIRRDRLLKKSKLMVQSVTGLAEKFGRINRLLTILYRRQTRIPFEYEQQGDVVNFRVRLPSPLKAPDQNLFAILAYFNFEIEDLQGFGSFSCCSARGRNDIVEFIVELPHAFSADWSPLMTYFVKQTLAFFQRLPTRSPAAFQPIPHVSSG
ncbi:GIY-YIG nuclease family protein [Undibacterium terreum]|uniref:GIY-YIG nuclease family protein n=1 Tax=Undibacterium terreum TaxID=1224302 RepID=UPI00166D5E6B|nr:GIY-YIG nuclease family protein [Undibacterium terreum]